jgi:PAS domain S-box-containing protein
MKYNAGFPKLVASSLLAVAAVAIASGIFVIDTATPVEGAIAVLYVIVVLIAAHFFQRRGIILVSYGCVALTALSHLLQHGFNTGGSIVRLFVSVAAIGIAAFLALQVKQRENELKLTIDTIPTLAWHARPDGKAEYLNKRWLDYTGLSLEQTLGWDWKVAVHPDDLAGSIDGWQALLTAGKPAEAEARLRRFDGEYRWFLFRVEPLRDDRGNIVKWYGTNTEIEGMKRAEDALRRSEAYLAEAQRLSRTGSFGWEVATGEIFWSEETYRIFGYDRAIRPTIELLSQRVHPDDVDSVRQAVDRAGRAAQEMDIPHRLRMPDGSIRYVHLLAHATNTPDNLEYVGALMDVTAARRAEEALHKVQTELAHVTRMTTLGELTASISHEVNQPLTGIVTNGAACLRWLDQETPVLEEARSSVEGMISDAQRASDVIQRIRTLAKKADPEKVPLDINDVINAVVLLVQREVLGNGVALRLELAPALPAVHGDRVQLQQVIINLVINGIQAMASVIGRPREMLIRSQPGEAGHVLVDVRDSGVGIDPKNADRLFNAFFTTKPNGMGMGLSICRSIIEAHGGRVWASGHLGDGATFQFILPTGQNGAS